MRNFFGSSPITGRTFLATGLYFFLEDRKILAEWSRCFWVLIRPFLIEVKMSNVEPNELMLLQLVDKPGRSQADKYAQDKVDESREDRGV
jgi:hypothetical protein